MKYVHRILTALSRWNTYFRPNPARDWYALIAVAFVLLIASFSTNIWLFSQVTRGEMPGVASTTPAITPTSIDSVTRLFELRATREVDYQNGAAFIDPSRPAS